MATADLSVTSSVPKVPKAVKAVRTSSGTDRIEVMADLVGTIAAAAVTGYAPDGFDPLDFAGAGVGLGAGAGGEGGGASVGDGLGLGADDVWLAGCELLAGPLLGETAADRELADADGPGWVELRAEGDVDAVPVVVPPVDEPFGLWLVDDVVPDDVVPAALCAAVLANRVVSPNAVTRLSRVARQVSRASRRRPVSRYALRSRCLMGQLHQRVG